MPSALSRPPYDPELETVLATLKAPPNVTPEFISVLRARDIPNTDSLLAGQSDVTHQQRIIQGSAGDIILSIYSAAGSVSHSQSSQRRPGILFIHGGGFVSGNRFSSVRNWFEYTKVANAVLISVEYRLAPECPGLAPLEDCYAALLWVHEHAEELAIDPSNLMVGGSSAGGGLAAGVALYARDHNGPNLCAQLLVSPMLDDRLQTVSSRQYVDEPPWSRGSNETGWNALLGEGSARGEVSIYAAPGRATDLSRLPPAFIEVGSAEVLRDDCVGYATKLWAAGVQVELHVWPGAFHRFQAYAPTAKLSIVADETRRKWVERTLGAED
ncbi:acetyl esterase, partial [Lecanoromycetidae sp. Uapishka_2]